MQRNGFGANDMTNVANDTAFDETRAEARAIARRPGFWIGLAGAGIVIGLVGPFGTYGTMSVPIRIGYWLALVATTFWIGYLTSFLAASVLERRGLPPRWSAAMGAVAASIPVTLWVAAVHAVIFAAPFGADALRLFPYVVVIALVAAIVSEALEAPTAGPVTQDAPPSEPAWLDQLPAHLGRDLVLLQAQDHYVRVETALGETLIRTTIQEATEALGAHGVRVHRSWWVARKAIKAFAYRAGAPVLVLHNGNEVPVGRTYRRALRDALR